MKQQIQAIIPFEAIPFYPFNWLDEMLEMRLDPASLNYQPVSSAELLIWQGEALVELGRVGRALKEQTFGLFSTAKIRPVVEAYLTGIDQLIAQAAANRSHEAAAPEVQAFLAALESQLQELRDRLAKRYDRFLPEPMLRKPEPLRNSLTFKLLCQLTGDQLGLILKAADDTKLIVSRSISLVFKTLIPFLSTPNKTELSWQSVRSNSYHPEEPDKEAAIAALEALIRAIKGYR